MEMARHDAVVVVGVVVIIFPEVVVLYVNMSFLSSFSSIFLSFLLSLSLSLLLSFCRRCCRYIHCLERCLFHLLSVSFERKFGPRIF